MKKTIFFSAVLICTFFLLSSCTGLLDPNGEKESTAKIEHPEFKEHDVLAYEKENSSVFYYFTAPDSGYTYVNPWAKDYSESVLVKADFKYDSTTGYLATYKDENIAGLCMLKTFNEDIVHRYDILEPVTGNGYYVYTRTDGLTGLYGTYKIENYSNGAIVSWEFLPRGKVNVTASHQNSGNLFTVVLPYTNDGGNIKVVDGSQTINLIYADDGKIYYTDVFTSSSKQDSFTSMDYVLRLNLNKFSEEIEMLPENSRSKSIHLFGKEYSGTNLYADLKNVLNANPDKGLGFYLTDLQIEDSYLNTIEDGQFADIKNLMYLKTKSKTIGKNAFSNCINLEDFELKGDKDTVIGENAFYNCTSLTEFYGGTNVTTIKKSAFENCTSLSWFCFDNAKSVEEKAFYNCSSLERIVLSSKLITIGANAFTGCNNIKTVETGVYEIKYTLNDDASTKITLAPTKSQFYYSISDEEKQKFEDNKTENAKPFTNPEYVKYAWTE